MKWLSGWLERRKKKNGTASILNGQLFIRNPMGDQSRLAELFIPSVHGLVVRVNGSPRTGIVSVSEEDILEIQLDEIYPAESVLEHEVIESGMGVRMVKRVKPGKKYSLVDKPPAETVELEIIETSFYRPIPQEELVHYLHAHGFIGIIDFDALRQIGVSMTEIALAVLAGTPPEPGQPDRYELTIPKRDIQILEKGQAFARFAKGTPSSEGVDVRGAALAYPAGLPLPEIRGGVQKKGDTLYASQSGRLCFEPAVIEVIPQICISKDLTASEGPIVFTEGDVYIEGSALEGAIIIAGGRIDVRGGVHHAILWAKGDIQITGTISHGTVVSGTSDLALQPLLTYTLSSPEETAAFQSGVTKFQKTIGRTTEKLFATVSFESANSSLIASSGDIVVEGAGAYLCHMESGHQFICKGLVKGGRVTAVRGAKIDTFSAVDSTHYVKVVDEDGFIEINRRGSLSRVQLGEYTQVNESSEAFLSLTKHKKHPC